MPRRVTYVLLVALGALLGELAFRYLTEGLIAFVGGSLAPFCLLCAGAVWAMRDKLDAALDGDSLDSSAYSVVVHQVAAERRRFLFKATRVAAASVLAAGPAVSLQLSGDIWHWMPVVAGMAVGDAAYAYLLANHWDEQLRALRTQRRLRDKQRAEQVALEERLLAVQVPVTRKEDWAHTGAEVWKPH